MDERGKRSDKERVFIYKWCGFFDISMEGFSSVKGPNLSESLSVFFIGKKGRKNESGE